MAKWIRFEFNGMSPSGKTKSWLVISTNEPCPTLGKVAWYASWRCYAFYPNAATLFEKICLRDIADFCATQTSSQLEAARIRKRERGSA